VVRDAKAVSSSAKRRDFVAIHPRADKAMPPQLGGEIVELRQLLILRLVVSASWLTNGGGAAGGLSSAPTEYSACTRVRRDSRSSSAKPCNDSAPFVPPEMQFCNAV